MSKNNKNLHPSRILTLVSAFTAVASVCPNVLTQNALAKIRAIEPFKVKPVEAHSLKGVTGEASLLVLNPIQIAMNSDSLEYQDGKLNENIDFYKSPRCYLHFRKASQPIHEIPTGQVLKVNKIDNIYTRGSVHVTFWFDNDPSVSDLACITNYTHTLTSSELRETLGNHFKISLTKSVENDALFNAFPSKDVKVLSEDSLYKSPIYSARTILTDS